MKSLLSTLTTLFGDAFEANGLDRSLGDVVVSQRPELGQFQCNGALPAARQSKANPRDTAQKVIDSLGSKEIFSDLSLAGPGFINISLTDEVLEAWINDLQSDPRLGAPKVETPRSVVIDFGGPNVAKAMHVGHLRSSIIGEALQKLFRFLGDKVTSDVHFGDWGTQMGMLIVELKREQPELPYFDASFSGPYPEEPPITLDDLEALYPRASGKTKVAEGASEEEKGAAESAKEEARIATMELQQGRPGYLALWRHFVNVSMKAQRRDFDSLGVHFDLWLGESDVNHLIPGMIEDLRSRGFVTESAGAQVIELPPTPDGKELNPLILVKKDGGVMYGTTDMATIIHRLQELHADLVLYVVDARQANHFNQVFAAAAMTGVAGTMQLEHVPFGTMNGKDGKPFKTREGGVLKLQDLILMARDEALLKMQDAGIAQEYSDDERMEIARIVGIGAVKFADLMNHRASNYIFDLERFTSFEGKTGAYLLYAAVRTKSLLRKAAERGFAAGAIRESGEAERELLLTLLQLPEVLMSTYDKRAPNFLCEYVFTLAQIWSRFLHDHHILSEANPDRRSSWLGLAEITLRQFELILELLGIEIPERM